MSGFNPQEIKESPTIRPADPNSSEDIATAFNQAQNKNEIAEVLKELFDENKIFMITDLTSDEIKLMTRIYMLADMKDIDAWKTGLFIYAKLLVSKDRKSRTELLEAIKGVNQQRSFMNRMNPFNRGDRGGY